MVYKDAGEFAGEAQADLPTTKHLLAAKASPSLTGAKVEEVPGRQRLDRDEMIHLLLEVRWSRSRLSSRTFTRGSPRKPN